MNKVITDRQTDNVSSDSCIVNRLGNIYGSDKGTGFAGNVWDKNCISPALMTMQGGNRQPFIIVKRK